MGIDNITNVKKGQRLSAYTVNAIIDAVKGTEKPGNFKPGTGIRARTLFYTEEAIPPYSIFPLIADADETYDTFYAKYTVEKYDSENSAKYMPDYIGTNGRESIAANSSFFGYVISNDWDSPIKISDYETGKEHCGFQNNSWEATVDADGMRINGKAPQDSKTYYCRSESVTDPLQVASKMVDLDYSPEGSKALNTQNTWLYAKALDKFGTKDDSGAPKISNPLGLPPDRPVVIAPCVGFTSSDGDEGEDAPEVEAVAISADTRDVFVVNNGSSTEYNMTGNPGIYKKGNVFKIGWSSTLKQWVADPAYTSNGYRLAVCQRDLPDGYSKTFLMPYFSPEMNYGYPPNKSTNSNEQFTERCGIYGNEHVFSNKRLDYHYANGRYSYEPTFTFEGYVEEGSGYNPVVLKIEGTQYPVTFKHASGGQLPRFYPDIWVGDHITVKVDASGNSPVLTAISYPVDFKEGTYLITNDYGAGSEGYAYRGWEDVTDTLFSGLSPDTIVSVYGNATGITVPFGADTQTPNFTALLSNYGNLQIWYKTKPRADGCLM